MTDRKGVFTPSEHRNKAATSGSRTTASPPSVMFWSEPIGFGSPVIEPVLLPHRVTCSSMRLRIQRFLHGPFILEGGIAGFSTLSVDLGNRVSPGSGLDAVLEARRAVKIGADSEAADARTFRRVTVLRAGPTLPPAPAFESAPFGAGNERDSNSHSRRTVSPEAPRNGSGILLQLRQAGRVEAVGKL
jgi:hypothetical protein